MNGAARGWGRSLIMAALAGLSLWLAAGTAWAQTSGNVIWSGGAGVGNPYWSVNANWSGGTAPANPTPGIIYYQAGGQAVSGALDADWTVKRVVDAAALGTAATIFLRRGDTYVGVPLGGGTAFVLR
jgi:hypothetical protein